jgi:hypothetical protein
VNCAVQLALTTYVPNCSFRYIYVVNNRVLNSMIVC